MSKAGLALSEIEVVAVLNQHINLELHATSKKCGPTLVNQHTGERRGGGGGSGGESRARVGLSARAPVAPPPPARARARARATSPGGAPPACGRPRGASPFLCLRGKHPASHPAPQTPGIHNWVKVTGAHPASDASHRHAGHLRRVLPEPLQVSEDAQCVSKRRPSTSPSSAETSCAGGHWPTTAATTCPSSREFTD